MDETNVDDEERTYATMLPVDRMNKQAPPMDNPMYAGTTEAGVWSNNSLRQPLGSSVARNPFYDNQRGVGIAAKSSQNPYSSENPYEEIGEGRGAKVWTSSKYGNVWLTSMTDCNTANN